MRANKRALGVALSAAVIASSLVVQVLPARAQIANPGQIKAGFGKADATWHVGAGAGQYSNKDFDDVANSVGDGEVDPHGHSIAQHSSYGVQSRLSYRAIVVQDSEGDQVAFVKSDSYLAQDYLSRRVGQILQLANSSISYDEIYHMASHNHSSPYYMTPSWGVWVFQDAFDIRAFEYHAQAMAQAIMNAEDNLVPARMGATVIEHDLFKGMVAHKGIADDGTPKGYPDDFGDLGLSVVRFDDMTDPANPKPLGTMVNWGQHPEGLDNYDLITGEYVAALERFVERGTGAPMLSGQGDVGSSEQGPGRPDKVAALGIPTDWNHAGHAQTERGGYLLAQDVIKAWSAIGDGHAADDTYAANFVPFSSNFDVEAGNAWAPGPYSHPYPSVSNCRTQPTANGNPGAPVLGLPDCERPGNVPDPTGQLWSAIGAEWDALKAAGVPLPEQYDAPAFTGVEENVRLHLQAFKIGEVVMLSCSCEAQVDLILNVESRTNETQNDMWDGYDWTARMDCTQASPGGDRTCAAAADEPRPGAVLWPHSFTDAEYKRMEAEIHNPANGWDALSNALYADAESSDPTKIWGNFTHEELPEQYGYKLPIGTGHTGDYNGYTVSYREYMSYDHYRKALTSYGPHTADYMNTRLTKLAGQLNGEPQTLDPQETADTARAAVDEARQVAMSTALGGASFAIYQAWTNALPNDKGPAAIRTQPQNISRFDAATFSWVGGDNAVDNPTVKVQRLVDGDWVPFADQSGEIQTKVQFPKGTNAVTDTYSGNQAWVWTANFEAFDALPAGIGSTPAGDYRFVVDGLIRQGAPSTNTPYHFASDNFTVSAWDGLKVQNLGVDDGSVSFSVDSSYPTSYTSAAFSYIKASGETPQGDDVIKTDENGKAFCTTCSFRPWADHGTVQYATVTIERVDGTIEKIAATLGDGGRWYAPAALNAGDRVFVAPGDVVDNYGETNGSGSDALEAAVTDPPAEGAGVAIRAV